MSTFVPAVVVVAVAIVASRFPWSRLSPRRSLWLTTGLCVISASAVVITVAVLAGGFALGSAPGRWFREACFAFVDHHQVAVPVGIASVAAAVVIGFRIHGVMSRWARTEVPVERLTVVDEARPVAFAVGGRTGAVVVSTGMLDALDSNERRVLLAHERAHLDQGHDRFLLAAAIAAAVMPCGARLAEQVRLATERGADRAAVSAVDGDRALVARSIARAALAADAHQPAMAFTGSTVGRRVRDLIEEPRTAPIPIRLGALAAVAGAGMSGSVFVHHLGELAMHICS